MSQMYERMLNPLKGWPNPACLDYVAKAAPNVNIASGACCSLNSAGQLVLGVVRHHMGLFVFRGTSAADVSNPGGNYWTAITPTGAMVCLVASGSYELETTEFDTTRTYAINDLLRARTTDGKLTNENVVLFSQTNTPASSATAVVGIVSRPVTVRNDGVRYLAFWTVWAPGRANE